MALVSPKVYAILSQSEEGKDIIEQLPDMTQDECQAELDRFFGEGGKGASSGNDYAQAKIDDEAEEERYKHLDDDYDDEPEEDKGEVTDDEISEHLSDYTWQINDETTAGQYAQECADRLGVSKERVFEIIKQQAPEQIKEDSNMSKIIDAWEGDYEYKDEEAEQEESEWDRKHRDFLEKGKSTWNQKLSKGDKVIVEDKDGKEIEAYVGGFWLNGELVDEDTYEEGKDNHWHDFRALGIVDKDGKRLGNINAFQIKKHEKGNK